MRAARLFALCLLGSAAVFGGSGSGNDNKPAPQTWRMLAPFRDLAEFNDFRKRAREIARANGAWWASTRQEYRGGPLLAQAEPEAEPCDPAEQECVEAGGEIEEIVTTGQRASKNASITNNQESGVDEGDIVKAFDRFIIVLYHGRLFSIDTGEGPGALRLVDRVDAYQSAQLDDWIDEALIFDDTVLVTGYSYETDSSNIGVFRIGKDGVFSFVARYFIESEDYYSWENYATRIVDGKLVIYTPFDLTDYGAKQEVSFPRIRRWTEQEGYTPWQPLFAISDVYRPIQPALAPAMHVVSACTLGAELDCDSRGIVAPWHREMYVSPENIFLWVTSSEYDVRHLRPAKVPECEPGANPLRMRGWPSAVYKLSLADGRITAVHTEGAPPDQFALDEQRGSLWALVHRPPLQCDLDDDDEEAEDRTLALARVPLYAFDVRPPRMQGPDHYALPPVASEYRYDLQTRFTDGFLLYGSAQGRGRAAWGGKYYDPYQPGTLTVVRLGSPEYPGMIKLSHSVDRIELFGANAVTFGYQGNDDFAVSSVALDRRPRLSDTQPLPGVIESENRSHAFNALAQDDGSGIFGIPTMDTRHFRTSRYYDTPIDVQFITASRGLDLASAEKLAGHADSEMPESDYECEVSCIDWYGNARPIFFRDRIFALIGQEFVEGSLTGGRVAELARLYLTTKPAHARTRAAQPEPVEED